MYPILIYRLFSPLTDISILVDSIFRNSAIFPLGEWLYKKQVKQNVFGAFDKAESPKTSLTENSVQFIDFTKPQRTNWETGIETVRYTLQLTMTKVYGQTSTTTYIPVLLGT